MIVSGKHGILLMCLGHLIMVYLSISGTYGPYMLYEDFIISTVMGQLNMWLCVMIYLGCCEEGHPKCCSNSLTLSTPSILR